MRWFELTHNVYFMIFFVPTLSIKKFFEHMGKVEEIFSFSDTVKSSLMALKQKYLITYAIFCKFEK